MVLALTTALIVASFAVDKLYTQPGVDIFADPSCRPPCWNGIVPGVTQSNQAMDILRARRSARNITRDSKSYTALKDVILIHWNEPSRPGDNYLVTLKDVVTEIQIQAYSSLTLGKVIDVVGPPDFNIAYIFSLGDSTVFQYVAYYPNKGLVIVVTPGYRSELQIVPDLQIDRLYFFEPTTAEDMLRLYPFMDLYYSAQCTISNWQPWRGFGITAVPTNLSCSP